MHVLHRSHHARAITVTLIAAVLAIVLTLAITSTVSDFGSAPATGSTAKPTAASAARPSVSANPFLRNPFSSFLTSRVAAPWPHDKP